MRNSTLLATSLWLLPLTAFADENFRCGQWIASSDMSVEELIQKCGQPNARESKIEDVMARNRDNGLLVKSGETTIETWTYDRGQNPAMVITIIDGRIKSIERQK